MTTKTTTIDAPKNDTAKNSGPRIKTALPGPNAKRVLEGDDRYISPSYTRSYPLVVAAIQKQAGELIHMSGTDFYYESLVTLAERLSKIAPMPGPHRVYYGNSGAEAVECALK